MVTLFKVQIDCPTKNTKRTKIDLVAILLSFCVSSHSAYFSTDFWPIFLELSSILGAQDLDVFPLLNGAKTVVFRSSLDIKLKKPAD